MPFLLKIFSEKKKEQRIKSFQKKKEQKKNTRVRKSKRRVSLSAVPFLYTWDAAYSRFAMKTRNLLEENKANLLP